MRARNTVTIFKHFKSLKKSPSLPKLLIKENQQSTKMQEQVNMMNEFFHSVFSPKIPFSIQDVKLINPEITNFEISKKAFYEILLSLDATKSRGPNGIPPAFFQRTARETSKILNVLFKQIKRLRKIPNSWKIAAVTPIYKKDDRRKVENYRPVSLLYIDSKVFEKCICSALCAHFEKFLTEHQHGFVKKRSVNTNMLSFLKSIHDALDNESSTEIVAFYTDFSKVFDKVPLLEAARQKVNFTEKEITKELEMLVVTKSRGADDIPAILLKKTANTVSKSIKSLFNNIGRLHKVPGSWKHGLVSPIFKDGNKSEVKNYRPVTLLNIISKVFEKLVLKFFAEHLLNSIKSCQFGFLPRRSVILQLILSLSNIFEILSASEEFCFLLLFDFSKASDKIKHSVLMKKLARMNVPRSLFLLI